LTAHKDIEDLVAAAAATTHSLLNTCSALLVSPVSSSSVYFYNIEAVLLKLGLHSLQMGLAFIDNVLRSPSCQQQRGNTRTDCVKDNCTISHLVLFCTL